MEQYSVSQIVEVHSKNNELKRLKEEMEKMSKEFKGEGRNAFTKRIQEIENELMENEEWLCKIENKLNDPIAIRKQVMTSHSSVICTGIEHKLSSRAKRLLDIIQAWWNSGQPDTMLMVRDDLGNDISEQIAGGEGIGISDLRKLTNWSYPTVGKYINELKALDLIDEEYRDGRSKMYSVMAHENDEYMNMFSGKTYIIQCGRITFLSAMRAA